MFNRLSMGRVSKRFEEFDRGDPTKEFELIDCLGEGTYGMVWTAKELRSGRRTAVKIVPIDGDLDEIKQEIAIMRDSECDYIIKLFSSYVSMDKKHIWMSMEVCEAGSVNDLMFVTDTTLNLEQMTAVTAGTAMGLAYLHDRFIIHRDIKAGNVLLNAKGNVRVADFGVSAVLKNAQERTTTAIGAPFWMAPEVIEEKPYDGRADVWSLGITVIEMAEARPPNSHIHPMRALFVIPHQPAPKLQQPERWPPEMVDFVNKSLVKDFEQRPSMRSMLNHPFIRGMCQSLNRDRGRSPALEKLVKKHMPKIEAFRNLDEDDEEEEEEFYERTMRQSTRRPPQQGTRRTQARGGRTQQRTFFQVDPTKPRGAPTLPQRRQVPPQSTRRLAPIRPITVGKNSLKLQAMTLTPNLRFSTKNVVQPPPAPRGLNTFSARLSNRLSTKAMQQNMGYDEIRDILGAADNGKSRSSVRNTRLQENPDDFASSVMTKQFIKLLKKSKSEAPDLFEMLSDAQDPQDAMEVAIAALRIAVGKGAIGRDGSASTTGRSQGSSSSGRRPAPRAPRPAARAPR